MDNQQLSKECKNMKKLTLQEFQDRLNIIHPKEKLQALKYNGDKKSAIVKCLKCGFIWSIKPNNLEFGKGCPKCNKKISKGEQKIITWLEKNNIIFQSQYPIDIEGHHLLIDFYLPNQNLWIEYNGEQHYNPINFFGGEEKFQKQVYLDSLKQNYFKEKMLVISYLDFDNIESILESSTTIPKGSRN